MPPLGCNQHGTRRSGTRSIDRRRCGALENLDGLDVVRIHVRDSIHRRWSWSAGAAEGAERARVVVHHDAVDDEDRLARAEGFGAANLNRRRLTGVATTRIGHHVRHLARQRGDDVLGRIGALQLFCAHGGASSAESLGELLRPGAGHHDLLKAQRISGQRKVLRDCRARREPNRNRARLISDHARAEIHLLALCTRARHHQPIATFGIYIHDEVQRGDRDVRRAQRLSCLTSHAPSDGHGLFLGSSQRGRECHCCSDGDPSAELTHLTGHSLPP